MAATSITTDLAALGNWVQSVWPLLIAGLAAVTGARRLTKTIVDNIDSRMDAKLAPISAELHPNGGGSLKDAVNRIDHKSSDMESSLTTLSDSAQQALAVSTVNKSRLDAVVSGIDTPYYEMNEHGLITFVNGAYLRLFELTEDEGLHSTEWRRRISVEDLDILDRSASMARDAKTEWRCDFNVNTSTGSTKVTAHAKPLFYGDKFVGFSGAMTF